MRRGKMYTTTPAPAVIRTASGKIVSEEAVVAASVLLQKAKTVFDPTNDASLDGVVDDVDALLDDEGISRPEDGSEAIVGWMITGGLNFE